jgi:hypothetical protein
MFSSEQHQFKYSMSTGEKGWSLPFKADDDIDVQDRGDAPWVSGCGVATQGNIPSRPKCVPAPTQAVLQWHGWQSLGRTCWGDRRVEH